MSQDPIPLHPHHPHILENKSQEQQESVAFWFKDPEKNNLYKHYLAHGY